MIEATDAVLDAEAAVAARVRQDVSRSLFDALFPDEDSTWEGQTVPDRFIEGGVIFARRRYPAHLEFFDAGARYRERCFMAANRVGKCSTHNSLVDTPGGPLRVGDLYATGRQFDLFAWDGGARVTARASAPFRKPAEPCVRLVMADGASFEAALGHRLLTLDGWLHVGDFVQLSRLRGGFAPDRLLSSLGYGPSVRVEGGRSSGRTVPGSPGDYPGGRNSCGGQPRWSKAGAQAIQPLRADAQRHSHLPWRSDDLVARAPSSHHEGHDRLSSQGVLRRIAALVAEFSGRAAGTSGRWLFDLLQGFGPLLAAGGVAFRSGSEAPQYRREPVFSTVDAVGFGVSSRSAREHLVGRRAHRPLPCATSPGREVGIELGPCPLDVPELGSGGVARAYFIGYHEVYDFEVERYANYVGGGLVHHNTIVGAYELTAHLTGRYPDWWTGRRWEHPIRAWAAGRTNETTRDIVQATLLGDVRPIVDGHKGVTGTGIVPGALIGEVSWKAGVADLVDTVRVRHRTGEWSLLGLKSYQQGRGSFEGTGIQVCWDDEEPPEDVYGEQLVRTATTHGMIYLTFTPLAGRSQVVKSFLPTDWRPDV